MRGLPVGSGAVDIFPQVKESLTSFLEELDVGVRVVVAPFADGLKGLQQFSVQTEADIQRIQEYVQSLEANGSETHVYDSLIEAFGVYRETAGEERIGGVIVYTDGLDNSPSGKSMADAMREFGLLRQRDDWIYYSTLGSELPPGDIAVLDSTTNVVYNDNPRGTVRPIRIIQPVFPFLNFGNLLEAPGTARTMIFRTRSKNGLPDGLQITASAQFDPEDAQGGAFAVTGMPSSLRAPSDTVSLALEMLNPFPLGTYDGTIRFEASDQSVIVAPSEVRVEFRYRPAPTVELRSAGGGGMEIDFGRLSAYEDSAAARVSHRFSLMFNAEAQRERGDLRVQIDPAEGSPILPEYALLVNGRSNFNHVLDLSQADAITFTAFVDENVEAGVYEGVFRVGPGSIEVVGGEGESGEIEIPWRVSVEGAPRSLASWIALLLGALAMLAALGIGAVFAMTGKLPWQRDRLRGRLSVIDGPGGTLQQEVELQGRTEVVIGAGKEYLPDATASVRIRPRRTGRRVETRVDVVDGTPQIRRQGQTFADGFATEDLHTGDRLLLDPYTLEYV